MPSGWLEDEPELIPDPSAEKPSDWQVKFFNFNSFFVVFDNNLFNLTI